VLLSLVQTVVFGVQRERERERDGGVGKKGLEVQKWVSSHQEIPICCPYL